MTCSRDYPILLSDFLCFIIRNRRWAYIVCIGFLNAEYHIVCVDFIVALRRTKGRGRRTLRSPPSPSSGLHLIHPGLSAAAGKCRLPRAYRDIGFRYPVQVDHPHFDISFGCFVFGLGLFAFQKITLGICLSFFIIGGVDRLFLRLRVVWLYTLVGFALTAGRSFVLVGNGRGWSVSLVA